MFIFFLSFRQLYLDIKKQIEEIDESKKEQVGVTFLFIVVVSCYECCSREITGMRRSDPFKIVFKCSLARKLCSTMLLKGVVFFGWMFNGFKQVTGLSKDSPCAGLRCSGRAFRLFLGAPLPGSTPPDRFALRPSRVWLVNRRAGYLKKKAADEPLVFCLAVGKSSQFVINYFTLPHCCDLKTSFLSFFPVVEYGEEGSSELGRLRTFPGLIIG